jgi:hypothetical protein
MTLPANSAIYQKTAGSGGCQTIRAWQIQFLSLQWRREEPDVPAGSLFLLIVFGSVAADGVFTLLLFGLGRTGARPPETAWKGSFYSNPGDPALLVPKRFRHCPPHANRVSSSFSFAGFSCRGEMTAMSPTSCTTN